MSKSSKMSRIVLEVTKEQYRLIKARAALSGKSLTQHLLEAVGILPEEELWLYDPANNKLVDEIKQALRESATLDLGSFKKYTEDPV